ncbi:MAG: transcription elongation factor GreB [Bacteriovoracaceae bacterium]|jgi:transcription elongation factor GreB|nr:transcription elongation factor GreB [Bacteriovoracaceae bacterium]
MKKNQIKNYISLGGLKLLKDEYHELQSVERPKVVEVVTWAASLGDRSENADYQYGKKRLREIDRRMRFLNTRINSAEVVDYTQHIDGVIRFGATVALMDEDEKEKNIIIVGADEIDAERGKISWKSPLGTTVIGKEVGDTVLVKTPSGEHEYEVVHVNYPKWDNS